MALVNPDGVPDLSLRNLDAVDAAGAKLQTAGTGLQGTGRAVASKFGKLSGVYDAPEAADLFSSIEPARKKSWQFGSDINQVGVLLEMYATNVRPLKEELLKVKAEAREFRAMALAHDAKAATTSDIEELIAAKQQGREPDHEVYQDWDEIPWMVDKNNHLAAELTRLITEILDWQVDTANMIEDLIGGMRWSSKTYRKENVIVDDSDEGSGEPPPWGGYEELDVSFIEDVGNLVVDALDELTTLIPIQPILGEFGVEDMATWEDTAESWEGVVKDLGALIHEIPGVGHLIDEVDPELGADLQDHWDNQIGQIAADWEDNPARAIAGGVGLVPIGLTRAARGAGRAARAVSGRGRNAAGDAADAARRAGDLKVGIDAGDLDGRGKIPKVGDVVNRTSDIPRVGDGPGHHSDWSGSGGDVPSRGTGPGDRVPAGGSGRQPGDSRDPGGPSDRPGDGTDISDRLDGRERGPSSSDRTPEQGGRREPGARPDQPSHRPDQPDGRREPGEPTQPGGRHEPSQPSHPGRGPDQQPGGRHEPAQRPDSTQPTQPTHSVGRHEPTQPGSRPEPSPRPEQTEPGGRHEPSQRPDHPSHPGRQPEPSEPGGRHERPQRPDQPSQRPDQPSQRPDQPAHQPTQPVHSGGPTAQPAARAQDPAVAPPPYVPMHPGTGGSATSSSSGGAGPSSGAGRRADHPSNHPDYGDPSYRVSERQRAEFRDKHPSSESYRRELDEARGRLPDNVDLSPEELDAINRQMGSAHQDVNTALRNRDTDALADHDSLIRHTVSGLNKFPDHEGKVHRGIQVDRGDLDGFLERHQPGRTVRDPAFVSADKDGGYPGNVQLHIDSKFGKDISSIRPYGNKEVAWGPDNNFEVTGRRYDADTDTWHIELADRGRGSAQHTSSRPADSGADGPATEKPVAVEPHPSEHRTGIAPRPGAGGYVGDISARLDGDPIRHATIDPSVQDIRPSEQATVARLAERPEFAGRRFSASPHEGADFVDDRGTTYDAMGDGSKAKYFNERKFLRSLDHHVRKDNDYTVLDMTGYGQRQIDAVARHIAGMPAELRDRIIKVGF